MALAVLLTTWNVKNISWCVVPIVWCILNCSVAMPFVPPTPGWVVGVGGITTGVPVAGGGLLLGGCVGAGAGPEPGMVNAWPTKIKFGFTRLLAAISADRLTPNR